MERRSVRIPGIALVALLACSASAKAMESAMAGDAPCTLVSPEVVGITLKLHGPPGIGVNGGCTFVPIESQNSDARDLGQEPFVFLSQGTEAGLAGQVNFTPNLINKLEGNHVQCETPKPFGEGQALWCQQGSFRGRGYYDLYILNGTSTGRIGFWAWSKAPEETRATAMVLAETVFLHRNIPSEVTEANTQWRHSSHNLKSGLWQLDEVSRGEGYEALRSGADVLYSCIRDKGASINKLIPDAITTCSTIVRKESASRESVAATCDRTKDAARAPMDYVDKYMLTLDFISTDRYAVEGTQTKYQTVDSKEGIATYKRQRQIGQRNFTVSAHWLQDKCGVDTDYPVSASLLRKITP